MDGRWLWELHFLLCIFHLLEKGSHSYSLIVYIWKRKKWEESFVISCPFTKLKSSSFIIHSLLCFCLYLSEPTTHWVHGRTTEGLPLSTTFSTKSVHAQKIKWVTLYLFVCSREFLVTFQPRFNFLKFEINQQTWENNKKNQTNQTKNPQTNQPHNNTTVN